MRESDRVFIFGKITALTEALQKEISELIEIVEYVGDADTICKRVGRYEEEADTISHDISYFYRDNSLASDKEAMAVFDIAKEVENLSDLIDDLAHDFVRYNVQSIREDSVISFYNCEAAAAMLRELCVVLLKLDRNNIPFQNIIELDHVKGKASKIYDDQMRNLFVNETNPIEIIKWQNVYNTFMRIFEAYESISEACGKYLIMLS